MSYSPSYNRLASDLQDLGIDCSPAEAHGLLCGLLGFASDERPWLQELEQRRSIANARTPSDLTDDLESLHTLERETRAALLDGTELFELCLPDDTEPLALRAEALRDWTHGLLFGTGLNPAATDDMLSPESAEALRDLAEIGRLDAEALEQGAAEAAPPPVDEDSVDPHEAHDDPLAEDEIQFNELVEYVRVASALLIEELLQLSSQSPPTGPDRPSLH